MTDFELLSLTDSNKWTAYLKKFSFEQQDIYFTPEYYQLYESLGDGSACCFVFKDDDNIALYPFLMNSVNKLGYILDSECYDIQGAYGYNGVLSSSYHKNFIDRFYHVFDKFCRDNNIIAEFTRFHPLLKNHLFSVNNLTVIVDRKTFFIDLSDSYENIFRKFQTTTRKQIKRCHHKYGLTLGIYEKGSSQLHTFLSIYREAMDRVNSIPYLYFNEGYFKSLLENESAALFIAYYEGIPIAAITVLYNKYFIHGHLGGALTKYLFTSAYSFLYAEIIQFGIARGCKYFHYGGGTGPEPDDMLFKYKSNFSNTTADFYIGKKIHSPKYYNDVINQWNSNDSSKEEKFGNMLLKYRY